MTSFAFILGRPAAGLRNGAGANARRSLGISVFTGMLASTWLRGPFVPAFFVVIQRFENWLAGRKKTPAAQTASQTGP